MPRKNRSPQIRWQIPFADLAAARRVLAARDKAIQAEAKRKPPPAPPKPPIEGLSR